MKGVYFLVFLTGLATAAIQPTGPVYRSASAINSSQRKPQQEQPNNQQAPLTQPQPSAEERESTPFQTAESVAKPIAGASPTAASVPNTLDYTVLYYPQGQTQYTNPGQTPYANAGQGQYGTAGQAQYAATGQAQYATAGQPQYANPGTSPVYQQQPGTDAWTRYRMNDILVGGAAVGLVLAGSYLWYPKLGYAKSRALRELSELKADDASRMVKGVMRALDKYYNMNAKIE